MFQTFPKRGKFGKNPGKEERGGSNGTQHTPPSMYSAVELGEGRPGSERRFTNNYGKNAMVRNEVNTEAGAESRRAGRMFNWMKGESY